MKFITDRIHFGLNPVSMEEIVKKATRPARTLDELLAEAQAMKTAAAAGGQVKTAQAEQKQEKTAAVEQPKAEPEQKAEPKPEQKVATVKVDSSKFEKKAAAQPEQKAVKQASLSMKVAKELDFRPWSARQILDAWKQHGSFKGCLDNVGKKASHPEQYCSLLRTAAGMAHKVVVASAKAPAEYTKFAKLSPKQKTLVREYFDKYYPKDYVEAMLGDY